MKVFLLCVLVFFYLMGVVRFLQAPMDCIPVGPCKQPAPTWIDRIPLPGEKER